jgi:ribbon-helix-helix CopG family protein
VRTLCHNVYMSENVSVRIDDALAHRLRVRARAAGESLSDRLRRYAEEGARRDEHPLITFRDGPTGRRAGLVGGPDVWEVVMWLEDLGDESDPAAALAEDDLVTRPQIDAALGYRAAYPDEIAARIELHRSETAAADTR